CRACDEPNGCKILGRIVLEVWIECGRGAMRSHVPHHDSVAIRLGLSAADDPGRAAGACNILYDDGLAERLAHGFANDPCDGVGRTTGGKGHDHCDGPVWIVAPCRTDRGKTCQDTDGNRSQQACHDSTSLLGCAGPPQWHRPQPCCHLGSEETTAKD